MLSGPRTEVVRKFRAERAELTDATAWTLRTVGARATHPALSGVRLEITGDHLVLSSTDLETSVS